MLDSPPGRGDNAANGGSPFGLPSAQFAAMTWRQGTTRHRWPAHWAADSGDFVVMDV